MKAVICPVCNGTGKYYSEVTWMMDTCHGCSGRGWVEVNDNPNTGTFEVVFPPFSVPPDATPGWYSYPLIPGISFSTHEVNLP